VHVEPEAEILADAMLLEDGADFPRVDGRHAGVTQQLVWDALEFVTRIPPCDIYGQRLP